MDITWPVSDPRFRPSRFAMAPQSNYQITPAAFGGGIRASEIPGTRWLADLTLPAVPKGGWHTEAVEAFLAKVRSPANRVIMGHLGRCGIGGTLSGTVTCSGAAQGALTTTLSGAGLPVAGDMLTLTTSSGAQWVMVTDVQPASGGATVNFSPPLRDVVAEGSVVAYRDTTTKWIVLNMPVMVEYGPATNPGVSLRLLEVWN